MEIRLLYENEIQMAVHMAHEVFEICVRAYAKSTNEAEQFYRYVQVENLQKEIRAGRLFLWGAFENGMMCAVSAMQNVGHITMLYVRPQCGRRRIGTQLLAHMSTFAAMQLHRDRVTINVMPISAASYFYHRGFSLIQGAPLTNCYVSLERRNWGKPQMAAMPSVPVRTTKAEVKTENTYPTKKVSAKCILILVAVVLAASFIMIAGVTVHHMVTEGLLTEEANELEYDDQEKEALPDGMGEPEEI